MKYTLIQAGRWVKKKARKVQKRLEEEYYELFDPFLKQWIPQLPPEELRRAIEENRDPKEVWKVEEFRQASKSLLNKIPSPFNYMASAAILKYVTKKRVETYLKNHFEKISPTHYAIILYTVNGFEYTSNAVKLLLKTLLEE